jgi:hypothetical protein
MFEKPPQSKQESLKEPDLVFEKKAKLTIGSGVKKQFIQKMKEYAALNMGRVKIAERPISILESEFTVDFVGTEKEYRDFIQYLQRMDAQSKQNIKSFFPFKDSDFFEK